MKAIRNPEDENFMEICFVIAIILLLAGSVQAATLTVCPSGCDYSSINTAINAANPGDTIEVQSGPYYEQVNIEKDDITLNMVNTGGGCPKLNGGLRVSGKNSVARGIGGCGITVGGVNILDSTIEPGAQITAGGNKVDTSNLPSSNLLSQPIFSDDFSHRNSGWATRNNQIGTADYDHDMYRINVLQNGKLTYSSLNKIFTDFVMEVVAVLEGGSDKNEYGVILRKVDDDNFYRFAITGEGNYSFYKLQNGQWATIVPEAHSIAILAGKAANIIKVESKGNNFTFYVNEIKLGECIDSSFKSGNIGLEAGALDGVVQASFDDLKVWAL